MAFFLRQYILIIIQYWCKNPRVKSPPATCVYKARLDLFHKAAGRQASRPPICSWPSKECINYTYTLKNVAKTWEVDVARSMNDRNVLIPPLRTAGPILFKAWTDLSCLVPKVRKYIKLEKNKSWLVTCTNTNILLLHNGPTQVKFPLLSWSIFWFKFPAYTFKKWRNLSYIHSFEKYCNLKVDILLEVGLGKCIFYHIYVYT